MTTAMVSHRSQPPTNAPILTRREQYLVRHRCQGLGIAPEVVNACRTMRELRPHVRRAYHALAAHYHPDHSAQQRQALETRGRGYARVYYNNGRTFSRLTQRYTWLMALPADALLHWRPVPVHELCAWLQALEPMSELPGVIERPHPALGAGWQEVGGWR